MSLYQDLLNLIDYAVDLLTLGQYGVEEER